MIRPYASDQLVPRAADADAHPTLLAQAQRLPSVLLNSAAATNAVMLGGGYFTPLQGYMNRADALQVAAHMHTVDGLFWPIPILNLTHDGDDGIRVGNTIALRDPNVPENPILAVQTVSHIDYLTDGDMDQLLTGIFGSLDPQHPGVQTFRSLGRRVIAGPITVLGDSYFADDYPTTYKTAVQIRHDIAEKKWESVVAFQTRNPMHRAHEELCKMALEHTNADGLLIHMLLGRLKAGDIPADVRDAAIRKMVELYFPPHSVMIAGYGFDMLYAGPREALLHAIFRQNCGCTHLIVGRDHAGVGSYYGAFDAQHIFDHQDITQALSIQIFRADHTAYSKKHAKVVMMRDVPDHQPDDFILLSGTQVRKILAEGQELPEEFARPEVAQILSDYYRKSAHQ